jgi:hypothetical protein
METNMSYGFLRYLTANLLLVSAACDSSVFEQPGMAVEGSSRAGTDAVWQPPAQQGKAGRGGTGGHSSTQSESGSGGAAGGKLVSAGASGGVPHDDAGAGAGAGGNKAVEPPKVCAQSCSADNAQGMCKDGNCAYSCNERFADCNGDMAQASAGDGCETSLSDNLQHCGDCNVDCSAPDGALTQCKDAKCSDIVSLADEPGQMLASHGTPIDSVTTQLCKPGSVLTGLEGYVVDMMIADSVRIVCSPLSLSGTVDQPTINIGKAYAPVAEFAGGNNRAGVAKDPNPVAYKLSCGVGEVVRQVRVTLWSHWGDENGHAYETVKDLAIGCAKPTIAAGKISFGEVGPLVGTTATVGVSGNPSHDVIDACGDSEAFLGFTLGYGANIDRLVSTCSALSVSSKPAQ